MPALWTTTWGEIRRSLVTRALEGIGTQDAIPHTADYATYLRDVGDERSEDLIRRRIRYQVARWGYSPTLFAWELFNETRVQCGIDIESVFWTSIADWLRGVDVNSDARLLSNTE